MSSAMRILEIVETETGRFAVRCIGAGCLEETLDEFDTRLEAEEYMERRALIEDERAAGLDILRPGGSQGLR